MPTRKVTFDFFTFKCPTDQNILVKTLEMELKIRQLNKHSNVPLFDYVCRIWDIEKSPEQYYKCNVEKINILDEAHIGDTGNKRTTVATNPNQGPLFDTAFLYNPLNHVLILQRNRSGLGHASFTSFLGRLTQKDDIELELILDPNILVKLEKMSLVKKVSYTISKPTSYEFARDKNRSMDGDLALMENLQGDTLKVEIGSNKGKELTLENAKSKIKSILGLSGKISRLNVRGQIGEDLETIDLIKHRVRHVEPFKLTKGKKITVPMIMDSLPKAYNQHATNLNRMYINR
ncbi:DUF6731 family protein [Peribacillus sp. TH24]|uniref:DUF6731 family protein n=1 Tax=Peribacillus sp. TH24 TaxID=2798483 RepID=UPI0019119D87|nr:DUF6731 family protein [Peribacillus sp. TH24]MBK5446844.1 hypothetical protein [Peribacillus sp. TH24]